MADFSADYYPDTEHEHEHEHEPEQEDEHEHVKMEGVHDYSQVPTYDTAQHPSFYDSTQQQNGYGADYQGAYPAYNNYPYAGMEFDYTSKGYPAPQPSQFFDDHLQLPQRYSEPKPPGPKKPKTGYIIFSSEMRAKFKADLSIEMRGLYRSQDIIRRSGEVWRTLSEEEKQIWNDKAAEDRARYEEECLAMGVKPEGRKQISSKKKGPRLPMSSYIIFSSEMREEIKSQLPPGSKVQDLIKRTGELWRAMSKSERLPWEEKGQLEKERYERECEEAGIRYTPLTAEKARQYRAQYQDIFKQSQSSSPSSQPTSQPFQTCQISQVEIPPAPQPLLSTFQLPSDELHSAPVKPKTGYIIFSKEMRDKLKVELDVELKGQCRSQDIIKRTGEIWRTLTEEERQIWNEKGIQDRVRYENECEVMGIKPVGRLLSNQRKTTKPNLPKMPKNSYIIFSSEMRDQIMSQLPPGSSVQDLIKRTGEIWRSMTKSQKAVYVDKMKQDRKRYHRDLEAAGEQIPSVKRHNSQRDPLAPKRGMSAFLHFSKAMRPKIYDQHPNLRSADVSKMLAEQWKLLSDEEKSPFQHQADIDGQKYRQEMANYHALREQMRNNPLNQQEQGLIQSQGIGCAPDTPQILLPGLPNIPVNTVNTQNVLQEMGTNSVPEPETQLHSQNDIPSAEAEHQNPNHKISVTELLPSQLHDYSNEDKISMTLQPIIQKQSDPENFTGSLPIVRIDDGGSEKSLIAPETDELAVKQTLQFLIECVIGAVISSESSQPHINSESMSYQEEFNI